MASGGKLRRIFTIVLGVGNCLNGGTKNGGAFAFHLSTLPKLSGLKTTQAKPQTSLLKWIARFIRNKLREPELLNLNQDIPKLSEAKNIELPHLDQRIQILQSQCSLCAREAAREDRDEDDRFNDVLGAFAKSTQASINNLMSGRDAMLETLGQVYEALCSEPLKSATKDELATFWNCLESFFTELDHVRRKLDFAEITETKKQKRLEEQTRIKLLRQQRLANKKDAKAKPAAAGSTKPASKRRNTSRRTKRKPKGREAMHDLMNAASMAPPSDVIKGFQRAHRRAGDYNFNK